MSKKLVILGIFVVIGLTAGGIWVTIGKNTNPTATQTWRPGVWCADVTP